MRPPCRADVSSCRCGHASERKNGSSRGNTYEEGETNFGLGMLMVGVATLVFLILTSLFSFRFFRSLNKRFGIPIKPESSSQEISK